MQQPCSSIQSIQISLGPETETSGLEQFGEADGGGSTLVGTLYYPRTYFRRQIIEMSGRREGRRGAGTDLKEATKWRFAGSGRAYGRRLIRNRLTRLSDG